MDDATQQLFYAFDGHDLAGVQTALANGADAVSPVDRKAPIYWLLEEYTRSDRLPGCLRALLESGAVLDDSFLDPILLDDGDAIKALAAEEPSLITHRTSLRSSFTSLVDVTFLHVAAEYGNQNAARALVELGADVNAAASKDKFGIGGHTPIFHTVNSNANRSSPIMEMLIDAGARCDIRVDGVYWGKGYPWETIFFDVSPISYAQLGLMPQVHRLAEDIYANIEKLVTASGRQMPELENVPNRYLQS